MTLPDFSFESVDADDYRRLRPDYSPAAVAWLAEEVGLGDGSCVLDLGAGPGSLTRRFVEAGVPVIGVEPASNMRAKLAQVVGSDRALDGTAEAIPLSDSTVDCVVAAQAVHWFRPQEAVIEIHRVLRPGGAFAWFWTVYGDGAAERSVEARQDEPGHAPAALVEIVNRHEPPGWLDQLLDMPPG
ncbi:MAG: class I SAM-dependent methyltransferase [Actinomycetota bacterium]|nr:class I SAM-dependent methyltransferase [Actinomycetota bacterium]